MSHTAEIIAVGTELLLGNIVNTNAQDISQALSAVGVNVFWHTVVGDNPQRLKEALDVARRRADIIITTGGLGPTYDDLTKQTICESFGKPLVLHQDILDGLKVFFEKNVHMKMPSNNLQQAELPEGCTVFDNPVGTAPGCAFEADGVHVLMLPGPPFEMLTMLKGHVIPYLRGLSSEVIVSHDIMTFGLGESPMEELMREKMSRMENPSLATYAKPSEVRLRATAKAESVEAAEAMLSPVVKDVTDFLGDYVYGVDVASLEDVCFRLLKEKGLTFATAESCTGGRVAERMTALPGVSAVYRGGVVSYWTSVKADVLGVPADILEAHGAVSEETARAMAEGARRVTGADIAVSVTGVAGPDPDERGVAVGIVYIGLATPDGTFCRPLDLGKRRRDRIQDLASNHALDVVRRYLSGLPIELSR
ncbi:competence/damage-inducible protein A [Oscillibacter valericigenes]|uniref:competence/damage-inducible protein A n=1 Tax=Oscillibacter valericigenes TaxID=351091 RepID=UPI001F1A65D5|nr:competence/damage-inducible protein A [Oscillibacter valericigenes]MCF2616312.1 competence/damage-inducible protein A [Oscillibacter valericigenes]